MVKHLQTRHKLILVIMATSLVCMVMTGVAFVIHDKRHMEKLMIEEITVLARIIADRSTAAFMFDDPNLAQQNLTALSSKSSIVSATMRNKDGNIFATFSRSATTLPQTPPEIYDTITYQFQDNTFVLSLPVKVEDEQIGLLSIVSHLEELTQRVWQQITTGLVIVGFGSIIALILAFKLERIISEPITLLATTARTITDRNDYTIRCQTSNLHDEIGSLVLAFNNMLDQIETREKKLIKRADEFRSFVDCSPLAMAIIDASKNIIHLNQKFVELFGYTTDEITSVDDWLSLALPDKQHRDDLKNKRQRLLIKATSDEKVILPQESKFTCKDGTQRHIILQTSSVGGRIITIFTDLTERDAEEEEKRRLKERLNQAQKMEAIGTLAGGIAHDFNNILSIILGYSSIVQEDPKLDPRSAERLQLVLDAGTRAQNLVQQILAFSRQTKVERIPLQIQSLVKEILKMLRSSLPTTIEIREDLDSQCGTILADPTQLHQIIMNLSTNAYHAMEKNGGILHIGLATVLIEHNDRRLDLGIEPGEYVELAISDTGSGIPSEIADRIFEPFFTTKEVGKGTGMGLSIVHGIIADYGGAISVESEIGKGTTFHTYFPVYHATEETLLMPNGDSQIPRGSERVFFIDDEEFLANLGKNMLEDLGYSVTTQSSSIEALAIFRENPEAFDVIITDQTMPSLTGAELAKQILQIRPDVPIILCTGYSTLIDEASAKTIGIREFALKPLTKEKTANLIRKVLHETGDEKVQKE